jgi:hypothetical protein
MGWTKSELGVRYGLPAAEFIKQNRAAALAQIAELWLAEPAKRTWAEARGHIGTPDEVLWLVAAGPWLSASDAVSAVYRTRSRKRTTRGIAHLNDLMLHLVLNITADAWQSAAQAVDDLFKGERSSVTARPRTRPA